MTEDDTRPVRILYPIPEDDDGALVMRHVSGGRAALQFFLGPPERRARLFAGAVNRDRVIGAVGEGKSLGFASFKLAGRGPYAPKLIAFRKEYGLLRGLFLFAVFAITEIRDRSPDFYLYGLNVVAEERRRGVASALLDAVALVAARAGCDTIALEVGVENEKAVNLYLSKGYVAKKVFSLGPLRRLFPFSALIRMELAVASVRPEAPRGAVADAGGA